MKAVDNFAARFAEALKEKLTDLVFVPPRALKTGDVVTVTRFTQFHNDNRDVSEFDATNGMIKLSWVFCGEGSLFLVLGLNGERADMMALESGNTGWLYQDDLKHFE